MTTPAAELLETREILPGQWLQRYHAPGLAARAQAGQFAQVRDPGFSGLVLRRPVSIAGIDRTGGTISILFGGDVEGAAWPARLRRGDRLELHGPLGRGFEADPRSHHLLLIAQGMGIGALRALADEALAAGRRVTLLFGAPTAGEVYPSSLLPEEIEYVVATGDGSLGHRGSVADLVPAFEAWADQAFACGPASLLGELARMAVGRDGRLGVARLGRKGGGRSLPLGTSAARRRSWLQVCLEQRMGCAAGVCLGCAVPGVNGPVRACREGPVFAADEIAWSPPA